MLTIEHREINVRTRATGTEDAGDVLQWWPRVLLWYKSWLEINKNVNTFRLKSSEFWRRWKVTVNSEPFTAQWPGFGTDYLNIKNFCMLPTQCIYVS